MLWYHGLLYSGIQFQERHNYDDFKIMCPLHSTALGRMKQIQTWTANCCCPLRHDFPVGQGYRWVITVA